MITLKVHAVILQWVLINTINFFHLKQVLIFFFIFIAIFTFVYNLL